MIRNNIFDKGFHDRQRIWRVVILANALLLILYLRVLSSHNWDPLAFVLLTPEDLPAGQTWGVGYDGRFSYHIALNPLGSTEGLDEPNYRYQRILYPILVKLFSFGKSDLVPWVMLVLNWVSTGLISCYLGILLLRRKASPWYVFVLFLSIGYLLAVRMDLLEPMAFALALVGWYLYENSRPRFAIIFFILSSLTKEIGLVFPFAIAVWEFLHKRPRQAIITLGFSALPYVILFFYLSSQFSVPGNAVEKITFHLIPYAGFAMMTDLPSKVLTMIWCIAPSVFFGLWAIRDVLRFYAQKKDDPVVMLVIFQSALISILPLPTWVDPIAIFRFNLGLIISVLLWFARSYPKYLPYVAFLWLISGLILIPIPGML